LLILLVGCSEKQAPSGLIEILPSWNEGPVKDSIINFVNDVTDKNSANYVVPADRIATFDNDGCLWSEKPLYFQLKFAIDRVIELAPEHPEWKTTQPFKAVLENDMQALLASGKHGLLELVMATHAGMTTDEFALIVKEWISTAKHPRTERLYQEMIFQPMLEILEYLRVNGFKTYIVSGGGIEFLRVWAPEVYGIPPEQIIGSSIKTKFEFIDSKPVIKRMPEIDFIDDKEGKPVAINKFIGKRPIAAFGNSDGDLPMLQWVSSGSGARFALYVHHTDAEREWAYDRESHVGRLDKGLDEAREKGWTIVDMKRDWNVIYPFELR
jgi:phosphoserine phosphatase